MNINKFQTEHREFCNRYNKALDLYYRACEFIENSKRTKEEIEKYTKYIVAYTENISELLIEYKGIEGRELSNRITLGGFLLYDTPN